MGAARKFFWTSVAGVGIGYAIKLGLIPWGERLDRYIAAMEHMSSLAATDIKLRRAAFFERLRNRAPYGEVSVFEGIEVAEHFDEHMQRMVDEARARELTAEVLGERYKTARQAYDLWYVASGIEQDRMGKETPNIVRLAKEYAACFREQLEIATKEREDTQREVDAEFAQQRGLDDGS